ncbi:MAG: hypothetical protein IIA70_05605 [Proteobacteria bacterium]|nr:hypothetical protein [Pseudomonadota bacterium]
MGTPSTRHDQTLHQQRGDKQARQVGLIGSASRPNGLEKVVEIAGDGDAVHRPHPAAVFHQESLHADGDVAAQGVAPGAALQLGDQQAAAVGQGCFLPGSIKSTYGTGCFVLQNTGASPKTSSHKLLATIASRIDGKTTYALEGSIFIAGAVVQWLRDGLGIIDDAAKTEAIAAALDHNHGVYLIPAFTGLGAPHWDPEARGAILGLTRDAGKEHIVRAALEAVAYQTHDLFVAFAADSGAHPKTVRVDGGMAANGWLMQFLSDILDIPVERPRVIETTALGAAFLAGLGAGVYSGLDDIKSFWRLDRRFEPAMKSEQRKTLLAGWFEALGRIKSSD